MALSKEKRIIIFIAIDVAFFLLEIIVGVYSRPVCLFLQRTSHSRPGYTAHSLALVADAFHMVGTLQFLSTVYQSDFLYAVAQ